MTPLEQFIEKVKSRLDEPVSRDEFLVFLANVDTWFRGINGQISTLQGEVEKAKGRNNELASECHEQQLKYNTLRNTAYEEAQRLREDIEAWKQKFADIEKVNKALVAENFALKSQLAMLKNGLRKALGEGPTT